MVKAESVNERISERKPKEVTQCGRVQGQLTLRKDGEWANVGQLHAFVLHFFHFKDSE